MEQVVPSDLRLVLDLDDTLYLERDYVRSGFDAVGAYVADQLSIEGFGDQCWQLFLSGRRGRVFDEVLALWAGSVDGILVSDLVTIYRSHEPTIRLQPDAVRFLAHAKQQGLQLGLITDGGAPAQRAKIKALGIDGCFSCVVVTSEFGAGFPKPHSAPYAHLQQVFGPDTRLLYIADNPSKDFLAPNQLGWGSIRLRNPEGLYADIEAPSVEHEPDHSIFSLDAVWNLIYEMGKPPH